MFNPTTTDQNMQELTPDQMAAALGFSNGIQEQMMASQAQQEAPQTPQEAPSEAETPLRDKYAPEEKSSELGDIKEELKSLKTDILEAIKEDDNGEQAETEKSTEEA